MKKFVTPFMLFLFCVCPALLQGYQSSVNDEPHLRSAVQTELPVASNLTTASNLTVIASPDSVKLSASGAQYSDDLKITGKWFIHYVWGKSEGADISNFYLQRGYINFVKRILPNVWGRITPDITLDEEGDGRGDIELRLKYCFINVDLPSWSIFTKPFTNFGLVERPWLGFEQKVNHYRVQGPMFLERGKVLNSADYGVGAGALLGGEMPKKYQKEVSKKYPGRYGSFIIGVYNGGGYHAIEENLNKTIESRLTLRPLPYIVPGLQITWSGVFGKGNNGDNDNDWQLNLGYLSWETKPFVLTVTYFQDKGNYKGDVNELGFPFEEIGWSFFGEFHIPGIPVSLFGRYDNIDQDISTHETKTKNVAIAGIAWHFTKKSMVLLDYDLRDDTEHGTTYDAVKFSVQFAW